MKTDLFQMPGHLIRRLHQRSTRVFSERMRATGQDLTPVQFAALTALRAHPSIDQSRLAHLIAYDRATIGGVVERLERRGLIRRTKDARDRRTRILCLTAEGAACQEAARPIVLALQNEILANLGDSERAMILKLLEKSLFGNDAETPSPDSDA